MLRFAIFAAFHGALFLVFTPVVLLLAVAQRRTNTTNRAHGTNGASSLNSGADL